MNSAMYANAATNIHPDSLSSLSLTDTMQSNVLSPSTQNLSPTGMSNSTQSTSDLPLSVISQSLLHTGGYVSSPGYNTVGMLPTNIHHTPYPMSVANVPNDHFLATGMYPSNVNMYKNMYDSTDYYERSPTGYINSPAPLNAKGEYLLNKHANMFGFPPSLNAPFPVLQQQQFLSPYGGFSTALNIGGKLAVVGQSGKVVGNPKRAKQQEELKEQKERTVYVSEIDHKVTEEDLARLFSRCGEVVDCRLCGDAHSRMRFAFVEFSADSWRFAIPEALKLNDTVLSGFPIRVLRSKTPIIPVKKELLPRSGDEMERCQRTIYVSNIDRRLTDRDVFSFFEALSVDSKTGADGKVSKIRLLADGNHNTSIAFIEFFSAESAIAALNKCQGALMGCLPLRVSPSKTPVRTQEEERALRNGRPILSF